MTKNDLYHKVYDEEKKDWTDEDKIQQAKAIASAFREIDARCRPEIEKLLSKENGSESINADK